MSMLRNIRYNCKEATFLIERKLVDKLTLREKAHLRIHLYGCSICKVFDKQSKLINKMVKQLLTNNDRALDDAFKNDLQNRIDKEINKN